VGLVGVSKKKLYLQSEGERGVVQSAGL